MYRSGLPRIGGEKRIPIRVGERVPVKVSVAQRDLIDEHTLVEPELLRLLDDGTMGAAEVSVRLTLDDLEELIGFVCFEANHTEDRKLQRRLDEISGHLQSIVDLYVEEGLPR